MGADGGWLALEPSPSTAPLAATVIRRPLASTGEASAAPATASRLCSIPDAASSTTTAAASDEAAATSAGPPSLAYPAGVGQTKNFGTAFGSSTSARAIDRCQLIAPVVGSMPNTVSRDR